VIELLINGTNGFHAESIKKVAPKSDFSPKVLPGGLFSNPFIEDFKKLIVLQKTLSVISSK
jgi:hypothetical protein